MKLQKYSLFMLSVLFFLSCVQIWAISIPQDPDPAYTQVINQRALKIVDTLDITDADKALQVSDIIADQYRSLSMLHDTRDAQIQAAKERIGDNKQLADEVTRAIQDMTQTLQDKLHINYLVKLSAVLTPEQIDRVKDGMTYGVLQVTYKSYLDMLPDLTDEQKKQILEYLIESREIAMDAGSAKEKHAWFGKYKGKINNYLSAQGYDLKKASEERNKRSGGTSNQGNK